MRGTPIVQALGIACVVSSLAFTSDISTVVSQAQSAVDQSQYSAAIELLERALPEAKGNEKVLQLLRAAYRAEIPRLIQAGDRGKAQRYTDRLRIIQQETPQKKLATPDDVPESHDATASGLGGSPETVRVVVPPESPTPQSSTQPAAASQQSAWRPAKGRVTREGDGLGRESADTNSTRTAPSAPPMAHDANLPSQPPSRNATRLNPTDKAPGQANRMVSKADALFVAHRYAEAAELYDSASRTDAASVELARDRWLYCRLARTVDQINAMPASSGDWSGIRTELHAILEKSPGNAFAQSLVSLTDRRNPATSVAAANSSPVVRASEPDREEKGNNLLSGLAARIGLGANAARQQSTGRRFRSGNWQVLETSNFRIHATDEQLAGQVADIAESTRIELYKTWYGGLPASSWSPKCDVYVHNSAEQYARITRQGPNSPGHSQTGMDRGRVSSRRIDLRRDGSDLVHAILPHEITHVVLADRFAARPMPRWADEGVAVLTEPVEKKQAHLKNLGELLSRGRVFSARQLMTMSDYPNGSQWPMFYAESVSLVEFLVGRGGPVRFIQFMEDALQNGYETELKRVYGFTSFEELDRAWSSSREGQIAAASNGTTYR
jgi:hypothetical protein